MNNRITEFIARGLVNALGLGLLVFTAVRTVDLLQLTMPAGQQVLAYIGLAAFDLGLLGWAAFHLYGARGTGQRAISFAMTIVSLLGVVVAFAADTLLRAGERGTLAAVDPSVTTTAIWVMTAVIAANIAALLGLHFTDPAALRRAAAQDAADAAEEQRQLPAHPWTIQDDATFINQHHQGKMPAPGPLDLAPAPELIAVPAASNGHSAGKANGRTTKPAPDKES